MKSTILIVDDNGACLKNAEDLLSAEYHTEAVGSGELALEFLKEHTPDLILLDIEMPGTDGFAVMEQLQKNQAWKQLPVIFLTDQRSVELEGKCFRMGAVDYIAKPFVPEIMMQRVKRTLELEGYRKNLEHTVQKQFDKMVEIQQELIIIMANFIETRDDMTGNHVKRTSSYADFILEKMQERALYKEQTTPLFAAYLRKAAPMHDIGKIAIPDSILKKQEGLTAEEYKIMQTHCMEGGKLIRNNMKRIAEKDFLDVAYDVAASHHEKWDGTGYPHGLKGTEIPLAARIMSIADVFDALVSRRQYKEGMSLEQAFEIMRKERGSSFEPELLDLFMDASEDLKVLMEEMQREESLH